MLSGLVIEVGTAYRYTGCLPVLHRNSCWLLTGAPASVCVHFQLEPQLGGLSRMECGLGRTLRWIDSRLSQVIGLCSTPPCLTPMPPGPFRGNLTAQ